MCACLRNRSRDGYQQVLGAGENVSIGYAPVTNEDYAKFIAATGREAPRDWRGGEMPASKAKHPVVNISYDDAVAYCKYLTEQSGGRSVFRLPTEQECGYCRQFKHEDNTSTPQSPLAEA